MATVWYKDSTSKWWYRDESSGKWNLSEDGPKGVLEPLKEPPPKEKHWAEEVADFTESARQVHKQGMEPFEEAKRVVGALGMGMAGAVGNLAGRTSKMIQPRSTVEQIRQEGEEAGRAFSTLGGLIPVESITPRTRLGQSVVGAIAYPFTTAMGVVEAMPESVTLASDVHTPIGELTVGPEIDPEMLVRMQTLGEIGTFALVPRMTHYGWKAAQPLKVMKDMYVKYGAKDFFEQPISEWNKEVKLGKREKKGTQETEAGPAPSAVEEGAKVQEGQKETVRTAEGAPIEEPPPFMEESVKPRNAPEVETPQVVDPETEVQRLKVTETERTLDQRIGEIQQTLTDKTKTLGERMAAVEEWKSLREQTEVAKDIAKQLDKEAGRVNARAQEELIQPKEYMRPETVSEAEWGPVVARRSELVDLFNRIVKSGKRPNNELMKQMSDNLVQLEDLIRKKESVAVEVPPEETIIRKRKRALEHDEVIAILESKGKQRMKEVGKAREMGYSEEEIRTLVKMNKLTESVEQGIPPEAMREAIPELKAAAEANKAEAGAEKQQEYLDRVAAYLETQNVQDPVAVIQAMKQKNPQGLQKLYERSLDLDVIDLVNDKMKAQGKTKLGEDFMEYVDDPLAKADQATWDRILDEDMANNGPLDEGGYIDLQKLGIMPKNLVKAVREFWQSLKDMGVPLKDRIKQTKDYDAMLQNNNLRLMRTGFIMPYHYLMRHPIFRGMFETSRAYIEQKQFMTKLFIDDHLMPVIAKLEKHKLMRDPDMWRYMEDQSIPIDQVPMKYREGITEIRGWLSDMYDIARQYGYDLPEIKNYLPHMFEAYRIRVKTPWGEEMFVPAKNRLEMIEMVEKLEAGGVVELETAYGSASVKGTPLRAEPSFTPDVFDLYLTNKRYEVFLKKLNQRFTLDRADLKQMLHDVGIKKIPKSKWASMFEEREANNPFYKTNLREVLELYGRGMVHKLAADNYQRATQRMIERADRGVRHELINYRNQVLGHPTWFERGMADYASMVSNLLGKKDVTAMDVRAAGVKAAAGIYVADLGMMISSMLCNLYTIPVNASILGPTALAKGMAKAFKAVGDDIKHSARTRWKNEPARTLDITEPERFELITNGIMEQASASLEHGKMHRYLQDTLWGFRTIEQFNRATTYFAAKELAMRDPKRMKQVLDTLGVPRSASVHQSTGVDFIKGAAKEAVDLLQFRSERFDAPSMMRGAWAKTLFPYKTFFVNQYLLMGKLLKNAIRDPRSFMTFLGASMVIGGRDNNPLTYASYQMMDKALKKTMGYGVSDVNFGGVPVGLILEKGFPSTLGVDMSGTVAMQNPLKWLGDPAQATSRYVRAAADLGIMAASSLGNQTEEDIVSYRTVQGAKEDLVNAIAPRFLYKLMQAKDVSDTGVYTSRQGTTVAKLDPAKSWMLPLGMMPEEVAWVHDTEQRKRALKGYEQEQQAKIDQWGHETFRKQKSTVIPEMVQEMRSLTEELKKAKPGSRYYDTIAAKIMIMQRKLGNQENFKNALMKQYLGTVEREKDKAMKGYGMSRYIHEQKSNVE